jgi:hypothetical protein
VQPRNLVYINTATRAAVVQLSQTARVTHAVLQVRGPLDLDGMQRQSKHSDLCRTQLHAEIVSSFIIQAALVYH